MRQRYLRCWSVSASCGTAAVPLGGADEEVAGGRVRERGVDHDRLDVGAELERSVDLGLDVVLERAGEDGLRGGSEPVALEQRRQDRLEHVGHGDVGGLEDAVAVDQRGPLEHRRAQPQVAGAEARAGAVEVVHHVQAAVLGAFGHDGRLVGAAEHRGLPAVAVAAGVRGQPAVGDPRLELAAVYALVAQRPRDRSAVGEQPVGMEVDRDRRAAERGRGGVGADEAGPVAQRGGPDVRERRAIRRRERHAVGVTTYWRRYRSRNVTGPRGPGTWSTLIPVSGAPSSSKPSSRRVLAFQNAPVPA